MKGELTMDHTDCIFCKIANGEISSRTLYEDDNFRVIFDISPASKGHAIILPKKHAANIFEISEEDASKIYVVAKKVATALSEELQCDGVNILQNNGEAAGQSVFHLHMHIIPRYKNDTVNIKWKPTAPDEALLDQLSEKLKNIFG